MNQRTTSETQRANISTKLQAFYGSHNVPIHRLLTAINSSSSAHLAASSRFVRLNPRFEKEETLSRLKSELESEAHDDTYLSAVPWLDKAFGFYALPGTFRLSQSACYREGRIYGMDISSGAAVAALLSSQHDNSPKKNVTIGGECGRHETTKDGGEKNPVSVLDLCCAPGLKLCAMADYLSSTKAVHAREEEAEHVVVGVDISESRLATCKRIVHKYHIDPNTSGNHGTNNVHIRLFCCDGTTFHQPPDPIDPKAPTLIFDSRAAMEELANHGGKRKRMNKSARARERKRLKQLQSGEEASAATLPDGPFHNPQTLQQQSMTAQLYDLVLVDAECSTDGSLKHIKKSRANQQKSSGIHQLTDSNMLSKLVRLQQRLATSGFRLLKPGGSMVYSTCSLSCDQNENVVAWLLNAFPGEAFIIPMDFSFPDPCNGRVRETMISCGELGVRFLPGIPFDNTSGAANREVQFFGGGFFLAKIGKRQSQQQEKKSTV